MSDNVLIAIIAASGVVISAVCVLGGAVFAYISTGRTMEVRFGAVDTRLNKIDGTLASIQGDLKEFYRLQVKP